MLKERKERFDNTINDDSFPCFRALTASEIEFHQARVKQIFCYNNDVSMLSVVKILHDSSKVLESFDANDNDFNIRVLFENNKIQPQNKLYVDWYRFDDVDEISLNDLVIHFDDVWYPDADDITIYDSSFDWFLLVEHFGGIRLAERIKGSGIKGSGIKGSE